MATCSNEPRPKENRNYVTLDKLLKEVAEPVVRKKFDIEFNPAVLQKTLNKESLKIKKLTNRQQWNILFPPRVQVPVCSSDFDLTLMILLIRNLTSIQISDKLPVPNDTNQGADLSRIKYYRNWLAHSNGRLLDVEFEQQWVELCQAIVRLGGESYKQICAQLKVTCLSSGAGYRMKGIHDEIIQDWEKIGRKMVGTSAIKELKNLIKKSNCVALIGPSGCGKSTAVHYVALLLYRNEGYQIIPSNFPKDITDYYKESEKQLFIFDDVCGKYSLDYDLMKKWLKLDTELNKIKQRENVIILVSSRSYVFCQLRKSQVLFKTQLNMLSNDYSLSDNECFLIAKAHIGAEKAEILRKAKLFIRYDFFPLICQRFATEKERDIKEFFSQPAKVIKEELTLMEEEEDQTSFAVLALFVIYNNCITDEVLFPTSGIKNILSAIAEECERPTHLNIKVVKKHLECFLHSYVKRIGSSYMIMHDKLFDIFVSFYGEHLLDIILTHCIYPVIFTRFHLQSVEDTDEYMIKVPVEKESKYFRRLFNFSDSKDFTNIFGHNHFENRTFRQQFLQYLSKDQVCRDLCLSLSDTESSPLFITAAKGYNDIMKVLLDMGMNVNVCDEFKLTPLLYAAGGGWVETVKLLLENNCDINMINEQHKDKHSFVSSFVIGQFFSIEQDNSKISCKFNYGKFKRFTKDLKTWHKTGVDSSDGSILGIPLYLAIAFGHTDIVKLLLKQNGDIDPQYCFNITPLYIAICCNQIEIVQILIEHGYNINICNEENESPVFVASKWGHINIVKFLLDNNCDINMCNDKRESPLHVASKCIGGIVVCNPSFSSFEKVLYFSNPHLMKESKDDYVEIVKALLMRNADVNICNTDGETPMEVALKNSNAEIVKLFSEYSTSQLQ